MTKFDDIAKPSADLLSDDYTSKITLKCKKSAGPVAVTIETERDSSGSLASKIGTKFLYGGLSVDKIQFKPDGTYALEGSMKPMSGCKVSFKGGKGADMCIDYSSGAIVSNTVIDVKGMSKLSSSATYGTSSGVTVGGKFACSLSGTPAITSYNFGANYTKGSLFASLTSTKLSTYSVGVKYIVSPTLSVASSSTHSSSKPLDSVTVGGLYKAKIGDIKAKLSSDGIVSGAFIKEVAPKVTLTASGTSNISDISKFKYGLGIVM